MTESHEHLEEQVRAELRRRAEADDATPVSGRAVRARALRLRSHRRIASGAGAVAAVAVIAVPLTVVGARGGGAAPEPAPAPSSSGPSSPGSTESTATDEREAVRDWADALPAGEAPRIGYTVGRTYVEPDGTERRLDRNHYLQAFVPYRGGLLATSSAAFEGSQAVYVLGPDLREQSRACTSGHPSVSAGGARVYWGTSFCPESGVPAPAAVHSASVDGSAQPLLQEIPQGDDAFLSVLGPTTTADDGTAPVAYATSQLGGRDGGVYVTAPDSLLRQIPALRYGYDATAAGFLVGRKGRDLVVTSASGPVLWRLRTRASDATFSPDGEHLVAAGVVRDARSGDEVAALDVPGAWSAPFWEDDEHLLVAVRSRRDVVVVRVDALTGEVERATDWRRGLDVGFEVLP